MTETYTINFHDLILTVKYIDKKWVSRESELEQEIEKLKKQNEIMRQALEFYADIERWKTVEHCELKSKIRIDAADFDAKIDNDMMYFIAGKMARQALKDVEGVEGVEGVG